MPNLHELYLNHLVTKCKKWGIKSPHDNKLGRAWRHACSSRLMFKRGDFFDEEGNKLTTSAESPAGHIVNVAVLKTKTSKWDRKVGSYRLHYTKGVDILNDTIECALHFGFIENPASGSFVVINPETGEPRLDENGKEIKIRGKKNLNTYFEEHLDQWHTLYDLVYDKLKQKEDPYIKRFEEMLNSSASSVFGFEINEENCGDDVMTIVANKDNTKNDEEDDSSPMSFGELRMESWNR